MPQNAFYLSYNDVMGLCRLAYRDCGKQLTTYSCLGRKWTVTTIWNHNGFRAITVIGKDLIGNAVKIVSFSGTDELRDWNHRGNMGVALLSSEGTEQYQVGLQVAQQEKPNYFTGHSLGGGIALYCCCKMSIRTATINPSPLFNNIFGTQFNAYTNTSWAVNYCVDYEGLAGGRNIADAGIFGVSIGATPGTRIPVESFGQDPLNRHLLPNLAGFTEPSLI